MDYPTHLVVTMNRANQNDRDDDEESYVHSIHPEKKVEMLMQEEWMLTILASFLVVVISLLYLCKK